MIKIHCQKLIKRQGEDFHSTNQPHSSVLLCVLQDLLYKRFTFIMRLIYDSLVFCIHKNGGTLSKAFFFLLQFVSPSDPHEYTDMVYFWNCCYFNQIKQQKCGSMKRRV